MTTTSRHLRRQARLETQERIERAKQEARKIVAAGKCPVCETPLRRNLALSGWWQCGAYGEPQFRLAEHRDLPHCTFQTFTE